MADASKGNYNVTSSVVMHNRWEVKYLPCGTRADHLVIGKVVNLILCKSTFSRTVGYFCRSVTTTVIFYATYSVTHNLKLQVTISYSLKYWVCQPLSTCECEIPFIVETVVCFFCQSYDQFSFFGNGNCVLSFEAFSDITYSLVRM